jgi:hypothetical protein
MLRSIACSKSVRCWNAKDIMLLPGNVEQVLSIVHPIDHAINAVVFARATRYQGRE